MVFLHVVPIPMGVQDSSGSGQKHVTVRVSDIRVLTICIRITPPLAGFPVSNLSITHISYQLTLPSPGDQEGTDEDQRDPHDLASSYPFPEEGIGDCHGPDIGDGGEGEDNAVIHGPQEVDIDECGKEIEACTEIQAPVHEQVLQSFCPGSPLEEQSCEGAHDGHEEDQGEIHEINRPHLRSWSRRS